jgi:pimeloyl-ACP methyl ester carboxylesterase
MRQEVVAMASREAGRETRRPWSPWRRWGYLAALAAVAALAAAGCSGTSPGPSASPTAPPATAPPTTALTACIENGLTAQCGTVRVPQDWAHPDGPAMFLKVVVLPATAVGHSAGALFYLAGTGGQAAGDGNAVENGMTWAQQAFWPLNLTRDLVFVQQRGTAGSGLETCPGLSTWPASQADINAAVRRCLASASRDPRHDTTAAAVLDLDQVRKALGYDRINLYGVSYGVTTGLAYLQRFSGHVRAAVLDSGSLLSVPLEQQAAVHAQQAFDQLASRCAATPSCARSYSPAADLAATLAHVAAHPAKVTVPGPDGGGQTVTVTVNGVLNVVEGQLASTQTAVKLPAQLHLMARGEWPAAIASLGLTTASLPGDSTALQGVTIGCGDTWNAMDPATIGKQGPSVFAPMSVATAEYTRALCATWPHDPGVSGVVRSTVPVVFLNGTADPVDPPANVAGATATMPNALLVAVPGIAHFTLNWNPSPGCLVAASNAFLQAGRPASPAAWAACTDALAAQARVLPAP